jgi:hypothetical protein
MPPQQEPSVKENKGLATRVPLSPKSRDTLKQQPEASFIGVKVVPQYRLVITSAFSSRWIRTLATYRRPHTQTLCKAKSKNNM